MNQVQFSIDEVVPHEGTMSLLDSVADHGDEWLCATVTITPRSLFATIEGVPAYVGIEYMAQAIAAYGGIQRRLAGLPVQVGFLVGTRRYNCNSSFFPLGSRLLIRVEREFQADNGLGCFVCTIEGDGISADASLNVFQPDDVEGFLNSAS